MASKSWKIKPASWLPATIQLVILVAVAAGVLWPAPVDQSQLFATWSGSDLLYSHWPAVLLLQRTFAQSHALPFWNPYFAGGQPQAADPLAALFYPPTQLVNLFSVRNYFLVLIMGHLIFAGLGTLLLARHVVKLPRFPALIAAISYMATPRLISHLGAGHITVVQTVSWFPWLALASWATVQNPRRWGALLGVCIALTLLAGHPQMAYYGMMMAVVLIVWLLIKRLKEQGHLTLVAPLVGLAAAGVLGILMAAVHLLPLAEFTALSTRQSSLKSTDFIPILHFIHSLIIQPAPVGEPWENMVTPGLVVLTLAVIGGIVNWRKTWPLMLGIVGVGTLAVGTSSRIYLVVAQILPDFDLFRSPARIWFIALLIFALLAGFGTDALLRGGRDLLARISSNGARFGTVAIGCLTVLIVAISLIVTDIPYTQTGNISIATTPNALAVTAAKVAGSGRIYDMQEKILQVSAVELQVRLADGLDPLLIQSYVNYMEQAGGYTPHGYQLHIPYDSYSTVPNTALLGLMDVSVVVSQRALTEPHLVLVGNRDNSFIYKNTLNAGPAYLVSPGAHGNPPMLDQAKPLQASVNTLTMTPEEETFTFSSQTGGYFVIATPMFPGWTANLDGHAVQIQQFAGVMPALKVGPGTHTVSYTYTPTYVRIGAILSVSALLVSLAWFIISRFFESEDRPRPRKKRRAVVTSESADALPDATAALS